MKLCVFLSNIFQQHFQKLFELEDHNEEQLKQSLSKIESLESIVRMFELKTRNASDHGKHEH